MANEALKKKIAQIIADYFCPQRNEHKFLWGNDRLCYSKTNFAECERVAECTDALIAAGFIFDSERKASDLIDEFVERLKELLTKHEHRSQTDGVPFYQMGAESFCDELDELAAEMRREAKE